MVKFIHLLVKIGISLLTLIAGVLGFVTCSAVSTTAQSASDSTGAALGGVIINGGIFFIWLLLIVPMLFVLYITRPSAWPEKTNQQEVPASNDTD